MKGWTAAILMFFVFIIMGCTDSDTTTEPVDKPIETVQEKSVQIGTTEENLQTAIAGETNAYTKYDAYAKAAEAEGYEQAARLFRAAAEAERIHVQIEFDLLQKKNPAAVLPEPDELPEIKSTKENLLDAVEGETYESKRMYPAFINVAQSELDYDTKKIFNRAMLAEEQHAQLYQEVIDALETITGEKYFLCTVCGNIEKGEEIPSNCPICNVGADKFVAY